MWVAGAIASAAEYPLPDHAIWPRSGSGKSSREAQYGLTWVHLQEGWDGAPKAHKTRADLAGVRTQTMIAWRRIAFVSDGWFAGGRAVATSASCGDGCGGNMFVGGGEAQSLYLIANDERRLIGIGGTFGYGGRFFLSPVGDRTFLYGADAIEVGAAGYAIFHGPGAWEPRVTFSLPLSAYGGAVQLTRPASFGDGWPLSWFSARASLEIVRRDERWAGPFARINVFYRLLPVSSTSATGQVQSGRERFAGVELSVGYDFLVSSIPVRPAASYRPEDAALARTRWTLEGGGWLESASLPAVGTNASMEMYGSGFAVEYANDRDWFAARDGLTRVDGQNRWSVPGVDPGQGRTTGIRAHHDGLAILHNYRPLFVAAGLTVAGWTRTYSGADPERNRAEVGVVAGGVAVEARYSASERNEVAARAALFPVGGGGRRVILGGASAGAAGLGNGDGVLALEGSLEVSHRWSRKMSLGAKLALEGYSATDDKTHRAGATFGLFPLLLVRYHAGFERPVFRNAAEPASIQ